MAFSLSDYSRVKKIGGGTGIVFSATHKASNRKVIIKELASGLSDDDALTRQLMKEAAAAAALSHDNIVRVFEYGEEFGSFYVTMEFIDGWDLEHLLRQPRPLPLSIGAMIVLQVLRGLQHAHSQGLVHGDVKPSAIFISKSGSVKIADFGFAYAKAHAGDNAAHSSALMASAYVAPEIIMNKKERDTYLDIWSCGVVAYGVFAGEPPFFSPDSTTILFSIVNEREKEIRLLAPIIPETVAGAIFDCLNKDKLLRPPTLAPFIGALENFIAELGVRDIQKCIGSYCGESFSVPSYLTGLLVRYHLRKADVMRDAGDALGSEAHFIEVERHGGKDLIPADWRITHQTPHAEEPGKARRPRLLHLSKTFWAGATILCVSLALLLAGFLAFFGIRRSATSASAVRTPVDTGTLETSVGIPPHPEHARPPVTDGAAQTMDTAGTDLATVSDSAEASPHSTSASSPFNQARPEVFLKRKKTSDKRRTVGQADALMIGTLRLAVEPPQAHVLVDGVKIPNAALVEGASLTAGSHSIAAFCDGFATYNATVHIERDETQTLAVTLKSLEKGTGLLHVHSYPWAEVYVDDVDKGPCPTPQPLSLSEGDHVVVVKREGFKPYTETVHINKGEEVRLKVELSR
jgi:hypothetical protein